MLESADTAFETAPALLDLGCLQGPVLVFGGPYSNLQATQALRQQAEALDIPPERVICTGDVVAYCADPVATVEEIRAWGCHVLMGNCEESLAVAAADCGCGFTEGTACDLLSGQWYRYANERLDAGSRQWMQGLPRQIRFELAGRRCCVVHGSVSSINRFVFASNLEMIAANEMAAAGAEVVIAGHSGIPFTQPVAGGVWHNAGVIGMPANDGEKTVWYSLLETQQVDAFNAKTAIRFSHRRLHYDVYQAHQRMLSSGLDNGYASALLSGHWPSMDVLPMREKSDQGTPLRLTDVVYE